MTSEGMRLTLEIWRQESPESEGRLVTYEVENATEDMSFLEMLDILNEQLTMKGEMPVAFDHDCREGICGMCSLVINGQVHGSETGTTVCQLHMRHFRDGEKITIEPWRAGPFPILRDLIVDRSAFDRIIQAGGYVPVRTGSAQDANAIRVTKDRADLAFDAAACIGCGACVAACPNGSAMLFVGAKVSQLALLPQGEAERERRALRMIRAMDEEGFGNCTNHGECSAACPKEIPLTTIARLNREFVRASLKLYDQDV